MALLWIFLGVLYFIFLCKWILLLFLSPIIIIHLKRERRKSKRVYEKDLEILRSSTPIEAAKTEDEQTQGKKSIIIRFLDLFISLLSSYERYILIKIGYIPSHSIRNFLYKKVFLVKMGKGAKIHYGAEIRGTYNLILEKGAIVGDNCVLDARRGYIRIGRNVQLGNFVNLWTGSHDYNDPFFRSKAGKRGPIEIEDYCWLGPRSTVLYSVKIGEGAVVGAGSIVTKNVAPYSVMAGIPAHKVGERNSDLRYDLSKGHIHFY